MVPRARRLLQGEPVDRLSFLSKLKDHMEGVKHELSTGLNQNWTIWHLNLPLSDMMDSHHI